MLGRRKKTMESSIFFVVVILAQYPAGKPVFLLATFAASSWKIN